MEGSFVFEGNGGFPSVASTPDRVALPREEKGQAKACPTKLVRAMGGACFSLPGPQGTAYLPLLCRAPERVRHLRPRRAILESWWLIACCIPRVSPSRSSR